MCEDDSMWQPDEAQCKSGKPKNQSRSPRSRTQREEMERLCAIVQREWKEAGDE